VLCVLDASHLDRNLYLLTQVLEVGLPVVVALTMMDLAERSHIAIDVAALERRLGVPVIPVHATRRTGLEQLRTALLRAAEENRTPPHRVEFPDGFKREIDALQAALPQNGNGATPRFLVARLLADAGGFIEDELSHELGAQVRDAAIAARGRLAAA